MNRLKAILRKKTASAMASLLYNVESGTACPLSNEEIEFASNFLEMTDPIEQRWKCQALWLALLHSEESGLAIKSAMHLLENAEFNSEAFYLTEALMYLLNKVKDQSIIDVLLERFCNANCSGLRMVAAEYIIATDVNKGLHEMLRILPIVDCDHTTSDNIALWLCKKGDKDLKIEIEEMAKRSRAIGDIDNAEWYEWAAAELAKKLST